MLVILMGGLAWIYRKGRKEGMDTACERRIKEKIDLLGEAIEDHKTEDDKIHGKIFKKIDNVESKIDVLQGSFEMIKDFITSHK